MLDYADYVITIDQDILAHATRADKHASPAPTAPQPPATENPAAEGRLLRSEAIGYAEHHRRFPRRFETVRDALSRTIRTFWYAGCIGLVSQQTNKGPSKCSRSTSAERCAYAEFVEGQHHPSRSQRCEAPCMYLYQPEDPLKIVAVFYQGTALFFAATAAAATRSIAAP
jgi:hypothetical protein